MSQGDLVARWISLALFLLVAGFYYWFTWSDNLPILGGDHASYLVMADHFSPFSERSRAVTESLMRYIALPPLYPLMLGLLGATSEQVAWAHMLTVSGLLAALVVYWLWVRREFGSSMLAAALAVSVALLPATGALSLSIMSENLYLALSLAVLYLTFYAPDRPHYWWGVAALLGLAFLTRIAGIALVAAFAWQVWRHRPRRWPVIMVLPSLPFLGWMLFKVWMGYEGGYALTFEGILARESIVDIVLAQLQIESRALWVGWVSLFDPLSSTTAVISASVVAALCLAGTVLRCREGRMDGVYVVLYLGLLMFWPFPLEAQRFLYVVAPVLLLHGLVAVRFALRRVLDPERSGRYLYAYIVALGLTMAPASIVFAQRVALAQLPENVVFRDAAEWYTALDPDAARTKLRVHQRLREAWRETAKKVPAEECIYHIDAALLILYADRPAYFPPLAISRDAFLRAGRACEYFYVGAYTRIPFREAFYPLRFIEGGAEVLQVTRMPGDAEGSVVGMLVRLPKPTTAHDLSYATD